MLEKPPTGLPQPKPPAEVTATSSWEGASDPEPAGSSGSVEYYSALNNDEALAWATAARHDSGLARRQPHTFALGRPPQSQRSASRQVLEDTCRRQDFNPSEYDLNCGVWGGRAWPWPSACCQPGPGRPWPCLQWQAGALLAGHGRQWAWAGRPPRSLRPSSPRERLERPCGAQPVCVYMRDEVAGRAALQGTTLHSLGLTGGSAIIRFAMKQDSAGEPEPGVSQSKAPGSPARDPPAEQAPGGPNQGDQGCEEAPGTAGGGPLQGPGPEPTGVQVARAPPTAFVPFSGGGQRLGGPLAPVGPPTPPASGSASPPGSSSSPGGPSKPKKPKPGQEPRALEPPVERDPVVCHPDLEELPQVRPAELPDEFFEVTVDDVRRRLAQLKSERKRLEEAPLVTQALREAQLKAKLERYPKVALRVLFPDRYILQGFFRPSETVGALRDFVRSHLGRPDLPFYLFIAPPKTILDDHSLTLFQANLFPAALVHFGAEEPAGLYLAPRLLEHSVSPSVADVLVARCMSRAAQTPPPPLAPEATPLQQEPPEQPPGLAQPPKRDLGKVPKWLKLPASRRDAPCQGPQCAGPDA
ncbi:PREDICTED: tether containing UBX domain for GLUT4 [Condylura cristata]|uniref:tether containing UBX domain for GLUT4 n=1 Tax=Condylura cristata TaxID=143302 RepID=UPI0006436651|nr:PREDICTED: tether containing UBX domain for GLUT4 [Condylura cristata]